MILEITFNDNDFTQYIEQFLEKHHFDRQLVLYETLEPYKENKNLDRCLEKYFEISSRNDKVLDDLYNDFDNIKEDHANNYINLFKEAFVLYLSNQLPKDIEYLKQHLKIKRIKSVQSKWHNGEKVYWFTDYHKYITM